jgi:hypothetical protein
MTPLPGGFLKFIGVAEVLGAVGLVVPAATRIYPVLTPLAASGLVIIMLGATTITARTASIGAALLPAVVGLLCLCVALGRFGTLRIAGRNEPAIARP